MWGEVNSQRVVVGLACQFLINNSENSVKQLYTDLQTNLKTESWARLYVHQ